MKYGTFSRTHCLFPYNPIFIPPIPIAHTEGDLGSPEEGLHKLPQTSYDTHRPRTYLHKSSPRTLRETSMQSRMPLLFERQRSIYKRLERRYTLNPVHPYIPLHTLNYPVYILTFLLHTHDKVLRRKPCPASSSPQALRNMRQPLSDLATSTSPWCRCI